MSDQYKEVQRLRNMLATEPTNLETVRSLWTALGQGEHDLRSGVELLKITTPCIGQPAAAAFVAEAYWELAGLSGEFPRADLFDASFVRFICETASQSESAKLDWLCTLISPYPEDPSREG